MGSHNTKVGGRFLSPAVGDVASPRVTTTVFRSGDRQTTVFRFGGTDGPGSQRGWCRECGQPRPRCNCGTATPAQAPLTDGTVDTHGIDEWTVDDTLPVDFGPPGGTSSPVGPPSGGPP